MTPAERIDERAKELFECKMSRLSSKALVLRRIAAYVRDDWRRVARLTFKMERDAAKEFCGSQPEVIDAMYSGLLPGEE